MYQTTNVDPALSGVKHRLLNLEEELCQLQFSMSAITVIGELMTHVRDNNLSPKSIELLGYLLESTGESVQKMIGDVGQTRHNFALELSNLHKEVAQLNTSKN